ncbi:MAG: hypothetical protein ACTSWN_08655 [Promethearchaeota archaeon]
MNENKIPRPPVVAGAGRGTLRMLIRHRDGRLAVMGAKILVYNMWQVQRYLLRRFDPSSRPLELVEFLGRTCWQRDLTYAINVGIVRSLEA